MYLCLLPMTAQTDQTIAMRFSEIIQYLPVRVTIYDIKF